MPQVALHAPGTPSWVDLASPNLDASRKFYSALFGWKAEVTDDPAAQGYTMFLKNGKQVAGLGGLQMPEQPSAWSTYVATEDADKTAKAVQEAGGKVVAPPFAVMKAGRMAVFQDPTGAYISIWEAGEHKGAELVNEPGSFSWNELNTKGIDKAKAFYKKVFGWEAADQAMPQGGSYTEWKLKGKSIGGGQENPAPNVPPHWLTYFTVSDTDATIKKLGELGGKVLMGPIDIPQGRMAVVADPHGAAFAVIKA
ncbi:MAG: VOC family protein [Chloroflexi bacterium]|nr:MAG: VOC family protein [Chloroflexota bacterium]